MTPAALDLSVRTDFGSPRRLMGYAPPHYILSHHNHSHITRSMDPMGPSIGYWRTTSAALHLHAAGGHGSSGSSRLTVFTTLFFLNCFRTTAFDRSSERLERYSARHRIAFVPPCNGSLEYLSKRAWHFPFPGPCLLVLLSRFLLGLCPA